MVNRVDRGNFSDWWWTIDHYILVFCLFLMVFGILLSFSASPSVAYRIGITDAFHFVKLHIKYTCLAFFVMIFSSFCTPRTIHRLCVFILIVSIFLLLLTLFQGMDIKGARRWIAVAGIVIQPSEFMKPAFSVTLAWFFMRLQYAYAILLYLMCSILLTLEPDIGQTILITLIGLILFFLSGGAWFFIYSFIGFLIIALFSIYFLFGHVHERMNSFVTGQGDTFQASVGHKAILHGGWFGQGPGEGIIKNLIPDSHTDFVFSVAAEEYGIIFCMIIVILFAFIVIRSLLIAMKEENEFLRLSISGLALLIGFQSVINIAVNLHLMPPKGMTLPFLSYGGSSLLAVSFTTGCLLALTRRFPKDITVS
ncbi:MAG: cell division protein FtsW [Candidatus Tokpelaia sp. JSC161]|jgi:cell division protein FtsW|nr:MAG: cell division protein FtsW [Candidatus Tokpelaia sp. JSC161]